MTLRRAFIRLRRAEDGVTAVETAFILPVLLFGMMMLFELAHMALVIAVGNVGVEHAVQRLRATPDYYRLQPGQLEELVVQRMTERSFNLIEKGEIKVDVLPFDNLSHYGGTPPTSASTTDSNGLQDNTLDPVFSPPILSITVDLQQSYMTTLPSLFGLGAGYQYQYRQLLGNLPARLTAEADQ